MHEYQRKSLVNKIMESIKPAVEQMVEKEFADCCMVSWHVEDIHCCIEDREMDVEVSDKEAAEILEWIERKHDANIGVNWDVIEYYIEEFVKERDK